MMKGKIIAILLFSICARGQEKISVSPAMELLKQFDKVRDFTMTQSGGEAYFTIQSQTEEISIIAKSRKGKNGWETPTIASFSGAYKDMEPFFSPNGLRLYYVSNRPLDNTKDETKDFDIWYVEREAITSDWSQPTNLGAPVNSEHNEFYPALAKNGNIYFTSDNPTSLGQDDIFYSELKNGSYTAPVGLDENINSKGFEYNAYIAKDESYLLFGGYGREDGQGSGDIYISYRNKSGQWSKAKPLPSGINSKYMDYCPFVDEANNILYFTSRRSVNPNEPIESIDSLSKFLDTYENGNSRLYKAKIDLNTLEQ